MKQILVLLFLVPCTLASVFSQNRAKTEDDYYRVITIPVPENIQLEIGGMAVLPDGRLAASTRRGEIWMISNPYTAGNGKPEFRRFAHGLHEPLGLLYRGDDFLAAQRGEVTRLADTNADGEADLYESFAKWPLSGDYHQYAQGPVRLPNGEMIIALNADSTGNSGSLGKWRGWMLKLDDKGNLVPWATGLRSPAGMGSYRGDIFYTENRGEWVASGRLTHLEKGDFAGHPAGLQWSGAPGSPIRLKPEDIPGSGEPMHNVARSIPELKLPAIWFPHTLMGISLSDLKEDLTAGAFGPFEGQLFVGDRGYSNIMRADPEKVNGKWQGACFGFRQGLASGVFRMDWGLDGSMFVGQTSRGWSAKGTAPFALQRLVWTGVIPFEMKHLRAKSDGFEIIFTLPIDPESARKAESWKVSSFTYKYHREYGSPVINNEAIPVKGITVSDDSLSVRIVIDRARLKAGYIHEIKAEGILSAAGLPLLHPEGYYTLNEIPDTESADPALLTEFAGSQAPSPQVVASPAGAAIAAKRVTVEPYGWNRGPDRVITIGTRPGLQFDISEIRVRAGSKIQLTFNNNDDMQHNFVITQPGAANAVGEAALALGLKGSEKHYIPDMKEILFHSNLLQPESSETIYFTAPSKPGTYQYVCTFPGHHALMQGRLVVIK
ncbi:MAG: large, multifunctional secreted protein [Cytophagaceae bacterium SCN 52-12]|nr:MAG: large, multifunctional secreted protein [Cytophagaceae bacterium SCN 52-12]